MLPNIDLKIEGVILNPGDSLQHYTDGITNALNNKTNSSPMRV